MRRYIYIYYKKCRLFVFPAIRRGSVALLHFKVAWFLQKKTLRVATLHTRCTYVRMYKVDNKISQSLT